MFRIACFTAKRQLLGLLFKETTFGGTKETQEKIGRGQTRLNCSRCAYLKK